MKLAAGASTKQSPAAMSLNTNKTAHPTLRLDHFLRTTDSGFQHGEAPSSGDRFVRRMAAYGQVRPSVSFTSESRAQRPFRDCDAVDCSSLPPLALDPKGDPREGTLEYVKPDGVDLSFAELYKNHGLMTPSERYREHLAMKTGAEKYQRDKAAACIYNKRLTVLERQYPHGVIGVDGPTYPDTKLYAQQRGQLEAASDAHARHAEMRHAELDRQTTADDATAGRNYGGPHMLKRSEDICVQRKYIDEKKHPQHFLNTHERLFPSHVPTWDSHRAAMLRSHEVREKRHVPVTGAKNTMPYKVASRLDDSLVPAADMALRPPPMIDALSRSAPSVVPVR
eukprot:TRINITY_DN2500_c0_g4_i1.p1 TRINITY_DN2500_c0_g4~~TRINITY_DN2500_c0_g4_i1.p1  ORF type:complete len:338 (-),score=42.40 TRINITY_DN2500_c0_g4_i1:187-1200(-)